jgi:acetyl-CoA acetyltransferase
LEDALAQAGIGRSAIDVLQIYDPFTVVPLIVLEALGFAGPGKAGRFVADGGTAIDGALPTNTGGGQISGFYLQGVTPAIEALEQIRGTAAGRQVSGARTAIVTTIGGRLEHHASLVLREAS